MLATSDSLGVGRCCRIRSSWLKVDVPWNKGFPSKISPSMQPEDNIQIVWKKLDFVHLPMDHISTPLVYLNRDSDRMDGDQPTREVSLTLTRREEFPALDTILLLEVGSDFSTRCLELSTYQHILSGLELNVEDLLERDAMILPNQNRKFSLDIVDWSEHSTARKILRRCTTLSLLAEFSPSYHDEWHWLSEGISWLLAIDTSHNACACLWEYFLSEWHCADQPLEQRRSSNS